MIFSMTGFARTETQQNWGQVSWELRSVNHRYLDLAIRLPEVLRPLETGVRDRVGQHIARGKLECNLKFEPASGAGVLALNQERLQGLLDLAQQVRAASLDVVAPDALDVLRWPGIVDEQSPDMAPVYVAAMELLDKALVDLKQSRQNEGERLQALISQRCEALLEQVGIVKAGLPGIREGMREKLKKRLSELDVEVDSGRMEQELAIQLQKMDVDEELDRLSGHIVEVQAVLQRNEPVGRRLDFLMQELNREANTLASKSVSAEVTQASVEMKVLIEQMREQVQNIE